MHIVSALHYQRGAMVDRGRVVRPQESLQSIQTNRLLHKQPYLALRFVIKVYISLELTTYCSNFHFPQLYRVLLCLCQMVAWLLKSTWRKLTMFRSVGLWWGDAIAWTCGGVDLWWVGSPGSLWMTFEVPSPCYDSCPNPSVTPCYFLLYQTLLKRVYNHLYPSF